MSESICEQVSCRPTNIQNICLREWIYFRARELAIKYIYEISATCVLLT